MILLIYFFKFWICWRSKMTIFIQEMPEIDHDTHSRLILCCDRGTRGIGRTWGYARIIVCHDSIIIISYFYLFCSRMDHKKKIPPFLKGFYSYFDLFLFLKFQESSSYIPKFLIVSLETRFLIRVESLSEELYRSLRSCS